MRGGSNTSRCGWQPGDPTAEEIAAITADIRRTWSMAEHYRRAGRRVPARFASQADENAGRVQIVTIGGSVGDGVAEPVE